MLFDKHSRPSKILIFLYVFCLFWVCDIGHYLLKLITFGKVNIPRYSSILTRDMPLHRQGFFRKIAIGLRYIILDLFYFFVGIFFLFLIIRLLIIVYVVNWGSIPSIHEWRN
jgi:hypothetical protein